MTMIGSFVLFLSMVAIVASVLCLGIGHAFESRNPELSDSFTYGGTLATWVATIALTFCCALLVFCFMTGDISLNYVVSNLSDSDSPFGWLYRLSGLWAGRQGSLLFWAWLMSVFSVLVARRVSHEGKQLDAIALMVIQIILMAFVAVLVFSTDNAPFEALDPQYLDENGNLTGAAKMWGMNALLEHWAMAIHPPTLFIGYAGLTVPFAYAISAAVVKDPSSAWVKRCQTYALFAWLFLTIGIGLGSVWAYVVLGWGGYWGWDPVENASLLPWLVGLALIHSFTVYRQRGTYKRWALFCACLTFAFVIYGTFISRSGLVSSVHAFNGDTVSTVLLFIIMMAAFMSGIVVVIASRKTFMPQENVVETESVFSKDISFYINNLLMIVLAVLLGYLTISSALPSPLPFAGVTVSVGTYNTIARPLGILYCLLMAICPLLAWGKTDKKAFISQVKIPGLVSLFVFVGLVALFCICLYPNYSDAIARGGDAAAAYSDYGPAWYYNGMAVVGLLVASFLCCTALMMIKRKRKHGLGGMLSHFALSVILVGLIGSSMYVSEETTYVPYDTESQAVTEEITLRDYTLVYTGQDMTTATNYDASYSLDFDIYKGETKIGEVTPVLQIIQSTMQQKLNAGVVSLPTEDLFVVFQGVTNDGELVMNVRINPLIWCVWIGFIILAVGIVISFTEKVKKNNGEQRTQ